jgi:hypothetical protein
MSNEDTERKNSSQGAKIAKGAERNHSSEK